MWGYRLLRETDYAELVANHRRVEAAYDTLLRELIVVSGLAASRASSIDHLTVAANTAALEVGQLRSRMTGVPSIVPQIGKGQPLAAEGIGAGIDLFEDVGDERAQALGERGLLHDRDVVAGDASSGQTQVQ